MYAHNNTSVRAWMAERRSRPRCRVVLKSSSSAPMCPTSHEALANHGGQAGALLYGLLCSGRAWNGACESVVGSILWLVRTTWVIKWC